MKVSSRGVISTSDYWHGRVDDGTLRGMSSGALNGSVALGAINNLVVATSRVNLIMFINGSTDFTYILSEGPTITGSGTAISSHRLNLQEPIGTIGATFYVSATLSATGTTIYRKYIASGVGKFGGGAGQGGGEIGLAAGTNYMFQILPHQVGTFNWSMEYYVETD